MSILELYGAKSINCSLDFSQTLPYNYDKGCGWCDYTGDCKTHDYCSTCCTNAGDPAKYNGCRLQKSMVPAPKKSQPKCDLNFSQNGPYTYDKGCGWCDFTGDCDSHEYCSSCCTNAGDPAKYNGCRLQKSVAPAAYRLQMLSTILFV